MISRNQLKFVRQLDQKKYRKREGMFVAEGIKVVGDLLAHFSPRMLFATEEWANANHRATERLPQGSLSIVTEEELQRLSFQQHPQQVLAVFPIPQPTEDIQMPTGLSLALDGIQDPGNLGTIIRIADWFGIRDIYCSEDTVDAWNPKVVQATMGSIARVNIIYCDLPRLIDSLPESFPVYGTLLDGEDIYQQELSEEGLIVMGNEGNGISEVVRVRINRRLLIPHFRKEDTAESLNVAIATAITCSEFRRRSLNLPA